jgi:hypothetical protein
VIIDFEKILPPYKVLPYICPAITVAGHDAESCNSHFEIRRH